MADVLTNAGENHTVDKLNDGGSTTDYIGWGTGATAPDKTDSDLDVAANESRSSATRTQPTADSIQWQATVTATGTRAIVECGVFDAAGSGNPPSGGNLLSRHTFSTINVETDDQITFKILWTIS